MYHTLVEEFLVTIETFAILFLLLLTHMSHESLASRHLNTFPEEEDSCPDRTHLMLPRPFFSSSMRVCIPHVGRFPAVWDLEEHLLDMAQHANFLSGQGHMLIHASAIHFRPGSLILSEC
jgi:hypothetical protein